ncbi:MAG TPA: hypothetical protein VFS21_01115 [Roseiflexaceae bacterium]|nr:hypothetical protein [Roseiflexaceae bacterium]
MDLQTALHDPQRFVRLYGATPPRASTPPERITAAAERLAARVQPLPLDGFVVYDVQDESSRTAEPRPFPFLPTIESRLYARMLQQHTGKTAITYKCIAEMTEGGWDSWLNQTREEYGISCLSLVGLSSSRGRQSAISLAQATRLATAHPGNFTLGGVTIAERHTAQRSESQRLLQKSADGCSYFISQAVYHAETTIRMLSDYARDCRERGLPPKRIVLTFIPCGRPQTMAFMKWLGVAISPETERAILGDPAPLSASLRICHDNLRAILDQDFAHNIPLGVNIESVSINKEEIAASIELFQMLDALSRERGFV